ncbi:hypothetical protein INT44_005632 [Umbelopsis vinacea]|uniref:Uncharacterized protein n=1 Tax=Umbelopsis vinacea TaxID=44442 RepID=A0A8H7PZJ3_9FUNG|nr:hypothetical protein INT44_005632 [Umbelopsis vinacea]
MINNLNVAYFSKLDRTTSLMSQVPLAYRRFVKKEPAHQNLPFVITLTVLGLSLRFISTLYFKLSDPVMFIANAGVTMNSISPLYNISGWTGGFTENSTNLQSLTQYLSNNNRTLLDTVMKIDRIPFVNDSSTFNSTPYARSSIGLLPYQADPTSPLYFESQYRNVTSEFANGNTTMFSTLIADANAKFPYANIETLTSLQFYNGNSGSDEFWDYAPYVWASPSMSLWQSNDAVYPYLSVKDSGLYAHNPTNSTLIVVNKRSAVSLCQPFGNITGEDCLHSGVSMDETFIQECSAYLNKTASLYKNISSLEQLCIDWRVEDGEYIISLIDVGVSVPVRYKKLQIAYNMYYSDEVQQKLDLKEGFTPLKNMAMSTYSGDIFFLQQLYVQNPATVTYTGSHQLGIYTTPFDNDLVNESFLESLLTWFGAGCTLKGCERGQMVYEYASGYEGTALLIATLVAVVLALCTIPLSKVKKYSLFNEHIIDTVGKTVDYNKETSLSSKDHDRYFWRLVATSDDMQHAVAINDLGYLKASRLDEIEIKESTPLNNLKV